MKPKVSIIIPTYNQDKYIKYAVNSASEQDYDNFEIVISDDNSSDNTFKVIEPLSNNPKIKYFRNDINLGRVKNYHKALYEYASGDYALVLDGDDYLINNTYISKAVNLINNGLAFVFAKHKVLIENKNLIVEDRVNSNLPSIIDGNYFFLKFPKGADLPHLTILYNREKAKLLDFYRYNIISSDWESFLRLMLDNKIGFINEFVGVWRKHSENESKNTDLNKLIGNSKYIESCYQYAYGVKSINPNDLDNWRLLMLKRFFVSLLVRFSLKSNQNEFNYINKLLKSEYEDVFLNINSDFKYKLFKLIKHSKILTSFAFKYFLKQESFLEDNI